MTSRVASTAHMGVDACPATAAVCLVVVKTDQGTCAAAFPARVGTRAVVDAVVGAGADGTMGLSQAGEGDRPKFKVDRVPTQTDVAGGPTTKLFVVGEPSEALEFGNGRANNLLVSNHFQGPPWGSRYKHQHIRGVCVEPLMKGVDDGLLSTNHGERGARGTRSRV